LSVIEPTTVEDYLRGLVNAGYLTVEKERIHPDRNHFRNRYHLIRRALETPRVRKDGSEIMAGRGNEQLWRSMKMLGSFTKHELALAASTDIAPIRLETAKTYIRYLHRAGYLHLTKPSKPRHPAIYTLLKSKITGPRAPKIQKKKQVFDPNLNAVVWPREADHEGR